MLKKEALIFVLVSLMVLPLASAITTIASDDFEDGNLNEWELHAIPGGNNWVASTTDPYQGTYHAQSQPMSTNEPASNMSRSISTTGYQDITFSYYRKLVGLDGVDEFKAKWYDGTNWIIAEETLGNSVNDPSYFFKEFNLNSAANDNPNFKIYFECTAGAVSEFCRVDNVLITGNAISGGDTTPPNITIVYPINNTATNNANLDVNYTVSADSQTCWWTNNSGVVNNTLTCGTNVTTQVWNHGVNNVTLYASDSSDNINRSDVRFIIDMINPNINVTGPLYWANFSTATIDVNYTVSEGTELQACWWTNSSGKVNYTVTCGVNISGIWIEGINNLTFYANDTSGNVNSSSTNFTIDTIAPSLSIIFPVNSTSYTTSALDVNFTVSDSGTGPQACWWTNTSGALNFTITCGENISRTWTEGINNVTVYANDSVGNIAGTNTRFIVDMPAPTIALNSPANNSVVNENFVILNATIFDLDLNNMTVWFYGNDIVLNVFYNASNGTSFVYNWSNLANGNYNWSVIAFDGNENSTREYRVFSVNKSSTAPRAAIVYPSYSSTYRNNASVPLNFSVASSDLDSCWYSLDNGATNLTIANCANLTFDVIGSGKYNLSLFVNESINGLQGKDNLTFYVDVGDPTVHLLSPTHNNYTNNSFVEFVYIPSSNVSLANCSLWGDFNGSYILNETELSITGDAENSFDVNLTDGGYNWAVACSDVEGSYAITGNRTLNVDVVAPNITNVTQPSGAQSSGDLTFEYAVSDSSSTTCTFAITATSSGSVVFNNVNSECQNIVVTFNVVLADGSYNSDFIAQDGAGNSNSEGSSLSVSTGGGTGPSGGGGSSPGITGAFSLPIGKRDVQLVIEPIGDLAVRRGTSGKFSLTVTSRDLGFLNNCKLRFDGSAGELFSSSDANGFSFGEKFVYGFDVIVPENAEVGRYNTNIVIECDEGEKSTNVELAVFVNDFEIEIDDYERINNKLRVDYTLSEFAGVKHDIAVDYLMSDLDNLPRYKGQESVQLNAGQMLKEFVEFELPKDSFGEFNFVINADDGEVEVRDSRRIFLPSAGGRGFLTGLAISDENLRTLSIVGLVLLIALLVLGVFYSLRKFRRKTKRIKFKKSGRHLIEMEM